MISILIVSVLALIIVTIIIEREDTQLVIILFIVWFGAAAVFLISVSEIRNYLNDMADVIIEHNLTTKSSEKFITERKIALETLAINNKYKGKQ